MPGAIEAVDGVLAQVDSGAVTAGEAIELVLNAQRPDRAAQRRRGRCRATCRRPSIGVVLGAPAALVERRATCTLASRSKSALVLVPLPRSARQRKRAQRAIFSYPAARW